ncbi:CoA-binding protein [uncultured Mesonia sp.]|uniref:CoA-binding protein n=1 Tax=uncultured Mesonia sp. TaxID=399731 RepID=UPI00374F1A42
MKDQKKTLVLGASLKENRYSNKAIKALRKSNIPTCAIGLRPGNVADVTIETEPQNFENIDTVTLYINPKRQPAYYDYILDLRPKRVLFNPGTENPDFYRLLRDESIKVEVACTLVLLATNQY